MVDSFGTREIFLYFSFGVVHSRPEQTSRAWRIAAFKREFYKTDPFASEATPEIGNLPDTVNSN